LFSNYLGVALVAHFRGLGILAIRGGIRRLQINVFAIKKYLIYLTILKWKNEGFSAHFQGSKQYPGIKTDNAEELHLESLLDSEDAMKMLLTEIREDKTLMLTEEEVVQRVRTKKIAGCCFGPVFSQFGDT
jgi:hypothetical protein